MKQVISRVRDYVVRNLERRPWPEVALPSTVQNIVSVELQIGFSIPELLRDIYLSVGNGGFGPGNGNNLDDGIIIGIGGGSKTRYTVEEMYLSLMKEQLNNPLWLWPSHLLPFCDWGCGIFSCLDCSKIDNPVIVFDSDYYIRNQPHSPVLLYHKPSFEIWLVDWTNEIDLGREMALLKRPPIIDMNANMLLNNDDF